MKSDIPFKSYHGYIIYNIEYYIIFTNTRNNCYYKVRKHGDGFIKRLEKLFKEWNPDNPKIRTFTGNMLSDQASNTITHKWLSTKVLDLIK